jgi:hypothetical protein
MVFFTLNFISGMAVIGLILLLKTGEINFKYFSLAAGILGLLSLGSCMIFKEHYAPLLISQFFLGNFSGLYQLNQLDFATQKFKTHRLRALFISILNMGPSLGSGMGMILPSVLLDSFDL